MKLGTTTLASATITDISPSAKQAIHGYDWSDECTVTDMGDGPTTIAVTGVANGTAERISVTTACTAARKTETNLYFPSIVGESDDYYYRVFTGPARWSTVTATVYRYEFTAIAVVPYIYDAATGARVT